MGTRRLSREQALQALFIWTCTVTRWRIRWTVLQQFSPGTTPHSRQFFHRLVDGVQENRQTIDSVIEQFSSNWKLSRMSCVDRNVLRIAAFELLYLRRHSPKVSINEAIDVGKRFGTDESGAFINGILDSIRMAMQNNDVEYVTKTIERK
jgi:N utilization substance protein B